jgi:hypothetical protein
MNKPYSLLLLIVFIAIGSCDLFNDEQKTENTEAVPAGRIQLNYLFGNVEFKYVYNDGSNDVFGQGGQNGNFDSNYGTSISKIENGVKVIIGSIDRVMPFGDTVKAELKIIFNDDELLIRKLEFEKSSIKNGSQEWILIAKDILLFDENDEKKVYKLTEKDVCSNSSDVQYKLITTSYTETILKWNECLLNDQSHITVELVK